MSKSIQLDRQRIRELFDLRNRGNNGFPVYYDDPYPAWQHLRETGPVHEGIVHELTGFEGPAMFQGLPFPDRPHYSAFGFDDCDKVFRDEATYASHTERIDTTQIGMFNSILTMGGSEHRRYRTLVQPSFVPAKAQWWIQNWIEETVQGLIDGFEADGKCELNVDFDAAIPVLTITGSFGLSVDDALDIRSALGGGGTGKSIPDYLAPVIEARRVHPEDDLISVLCQASVSDEDGTTHRLTDAEILSFSLLLLAAGSGTTWKQLGITLVALLTRPDVLDAVREDRTLLRAAIEESVRWSPTDPMFSRFATCDTELAGVPIPEGAVMHLCLGAANRDPARWDRPDDYDIGRAPASTLGFGGGPHICLGMHVARAEIFTAISALLDRLPNLRLDPDAEQPQIIGMYERGPSEINVLWG
ncbi:MAG: cytochrome P450 [Acidimicrobiia bacterium]